MKRKNLQEFDSRLKAQEKIEALSNAMTRFAWENMIDMYDEELEKLAHMSS
ncbi:MAG: hypothetical protein JRJ86_16045 [Deltaproteobacteria bacterium]|nr:hypothetical protein [Deltaproteobacteria bacterium]MBW2118583.1 hypothetical protein [Deltaproteobacteria bacterium]MBW2344923.1 hypothetical protein [Deltaproteobacteria bacterium]